MQLTDDGLKLGKFELEALLAFAGDAPESPSTYGVSVLATEKRVRARATNGHIALDANGDNESGVVNEWFVHRDFLKRGLKNLDAKSTLILKFSGASLHDGSVVDEDGREVATVSWPQDAINHQTDWVAGGDNKDFDALLKRPKGEPVSCFTLNGEYLGLMAKVSKAAGPLGIDCFQPPSALDRVVFRCEGHDTTWVAVVMPMRKHGEDSEG